MDSEGENGQGESAQEGRASSGIVGMQAPAAKECPTACKPCPIFTTTLLQPRVKGNRECAQSYLCSYYHIGDHSSNGNRNALPIILDILAASLCHFDRYVAYGRYTNVLFGHWLNREKANFGGPILGTAFHFGKYYMQIRSCGGSSPNPAIHLIVSVGEKKRSRAVLYFPDDLLHFVWY